jgi:hypothetical protein
MTARMHPRQPSSIHQELIIFEPLYDLKQPFRTRRRPWMREYGYRRTLRDLEDGGDSEYPFNQSF